MKKMTVSGGGCPKTGQARSKKMTCFACSDIATLLGRCTETLWRELQHISHNFSNSFRLTSFRTFLSSCGFFKCLNCAFHLHSTLSFCISISRTTFTDESWILPSIRRRDQSMSRHPILGKAGTALLQGPTQCTSKQRLPVNDVSSSLGEAHMFESHSEQYATVRQGW
jgi:hypothetical protein